MSAAPPFAQYLLAGAAGASWLGIYLGMTYPHAAFVLFGIVGTLNAVAAYLGWGTTPAPPPSLLAPTTPS